MEKGPFDFWDKNAVLEYHQENVRIYRMDGEHHLFVDQIMYASTTERTWYIHNVMHYAKGKCLEIGLGLGVASKVILARPEVTHLLTVENNEAVIGAFGKPLPRHNILCTDIYQWVDSFIDLSPMYDLIFVDHYTLEDEEEIYALEDLAYKLEPLVKEGGRMIFWVDENAPEESKDQIRKLWLTK
jgi:spermidine synthase